MRGILDEGRATELELTFGLFSGFWGKEDGLGGNFLFFLLIMVFFVGC